MTLPIRVESIPGESLVSWLAAHATRMNCWWGEVLQIVMPAGADLGRVDRDVVLAGHLRDDQRDAIATATGTDAAEVDAMTLAGRYGQSLITIDPHSGRPDTPWGMISRQRFCPLCLKSDPGRDRLEWLLPWVTTCPEHRCYLADACTHDGHHQCLSPTWFRLLAPPLAHRCRGNVHTASKCRGSRCTARLSQAPVDRLHCHDPVLDAQQTLTEWLSRPHVDHGLYAFAPVGPDAVLHDILRLSGRLLAGADSARLIQFWGLRGTEHRVSYWDETLRAHQAGRDNSRKSARVVAAPAAAVSAWVTTAMQILTKPSIAEAAEALRRADRIPMKPASQRPRCLRYSSALTAADIMWRARPISVFTGLNDQLDTELSPNTRGEDDRKKAMLRAVRGGLWTPWCLRLDTGILSWTMLCQTLTRLLLATGCTIAGHEANRRLHIHPRANSSIEAAARRLSAHPQWSVTYEALGRLGRYLSMTPPPIDYQRRRDINYRSLLTVGQWHQLLSSHDLPLPSGSAGATVARNWLTEQLGGPPARDADGKLIMRRDGPRDVLRAHLTPELLAALDAIATDFLHTRGITDEPLRWTPPMALLDGLDPPEKTPTATELEQIHDLIARGYTVMGACHILGMAPEPVRYHLEQHPRANRRVRGPKPVPTPALDWLRTVLPEPTLRDLYERKQLARQTILKIVAAEHGRICDRRTLERLMQEYGIAQRAIPRPPTAEWIHAQHVIGRRRLTDMAAELGVPRNTISYYAHRYGIPTHRSPWWYDPDPRSLQLLEALGIDPDTRHPRLASTPTWNDLQILVATSQHRSFSAAARALGRTPCRISEHIRTLEKVFGQQVCDRATGKHPITLTDFGQQLVRLTTAIELTTRRAHPIKPIPSEQAAAVSCILPPAALRPGVEPPR